MTIESPVYASDATWNSIKANHSAKWREWNCGKMPTEKRLPCYLNKDIYIPRFEEMTLEAVELLKEINVDS